MNGISGISFQQMGTVRIGRMTRSSKTTSSGSSRKRLPYNFKQLSRQISQAKTSGAARSAATKMRSKLAWLYRKRKSGEYKEGEVAAAIIHAAAMERIAKRKVRHLEEEEAAENGSSKAEVPGEEEGSADQEELKKAIEEEDISEDMLRQLMEDIEELEEELLEETMSELQDMITGRELSEDEIDEMKLKHRGEEQRQLAKADLRYLRALFGRLEQEKKDSAAASSLSSGADQAPSISFAVGCVPEVEMTDAALGSSIDAAT